MKLMKKFLKSLFISAAIVASAQAVEVAPLYFVDAQGNRIAADLQQEYWNYLVKYKLFGNDFVKTGNRVIIHDESGWTGSNGYFSAEQPDGQGASVGTQLGGPIVVAGKITTGDGYKFTTGPIRGGSFQSGQNCNNCYYAAPICLDNTSVTGGGTAGFQAQPISNCPDQPSANTAVSIPRLDWPASPTVADIKISANNGEQRIVVPDPVDGSKAPYDMYMDSILTGIGGTDGAKITVSMPAGGRVTRIFVHQIQLGNHTVIQIVYRTPQEDGSVVEVPAEKYTGNLLFYTDHDINIKNTDNSDLLGTYISTGRIFLQSNINFAGQLIANELVVGNEFDGTSFVFVPIDPPVLDLKPQADTPLEFPENDLLVKVPIALDTPAPADVFIDYCFDLQNSSAKESDFKLEDGYSYPKSKGHLFPICGQDMGKVTILKDAKTPADAPDVSVWINVAKDDLVERPNETLRLKITNISGAVLPGNKLDGYFDLIIVDANVEPTSEDFEIVATEDEVFTFDSSMFKYESAFDKVKQGIVIMSLPEKGFLLSNGDTLTSSDLNKFIPINETTNIDLQFIAAKDEYGVSPAYTSFTFKMKDADNVVSENPYTVTVKVNPVNDAPVVNDATFEVVENSTEMDAVLEVKDVDDSKFDFAFDESDANYEEVNSLFSIDNYGRIQVKDGVVLNFEAKNEYTIKVKVTDQASTTDGAGKETVSAQVTIKILDDNEKPVIRDTTLFVAENVAPEAEVGKVTATDEDTWTKFTYSLADTSASGKDPVATLFTIDGNGLIQVAEGADLNYEERNEYTILAIVHDNGIEKGFDKDLYDTAIITIKINDVNENPKFDNVKDEYNVVENTPVTSIFANVLVFDPDAKDVGNLNVSLTDNKKVENVVSAEDLFDVVVVPSASADSVGYAYVKISVKSAIDYEALYADHFDADAQKVLFDVTLHLVDESGVEVTAVTRIRVDDSNEAPTIEDAEFAVDENSTVNTEVGALKVTDPDAYNEAFRDLVYNIVDEGVPFVMDSNRVLVNGELNHEVTTTYTFKVAVKDRNLETLTDTADVIVTIVNVNENPDITCKADDDNCNGPFYVDENSATGTEIHSFAISDVDADDAGKLTAALSDNGTTGADTLFDVVVNDANTEVSIVVKNIATLDYEKINPTHEVVITVIDAAGLTDTLIRTIHVNDVNEKPILADKNFTPDENIVDGDVVGEMVADEPDTKNEEFRHLEYTIITENMPFAMDTNKIVVSDASSLNFETSPVFEFEVEVKNCEKNATTGLYTEKCLADTANVKVSLQDVNEKPDIACKTGDANCNGPFYIDENSETGTEIHTFAISDVDADDTGKLTVSLSDNGTTGADTLFTVKVNEANTEVSIVVLDISKLDFEKINPKHEVVLTVTDAAGLTDTLIRTIYVNDVNEAPVIADNAFEPDENLNNGDVVGEMVVDEPDTKNEEFRHLDYAVITPDMPFAMDGNKVIVTDATKLDFETSPVFTFQVEVKNCEKNATTGKYTEKCLADTADVIVTLKDVNENPDIKCFAGDTNCDGPYNVNENSRTGYAIHPFSISDVDAADAGKLTAILSDNSKTAPTGADSLFTVKLSATNDSLYIVVKDGSKLDYEKVKSTHEVLITLSDAAGLTDTLIRTIHVIDVNEKPTVKDAEFAVNENSKKGDSVGVVEASDPDVLNPNFGTLYYSLLDSTVGAAELFDIDGSGKITVAENANLNYETDSVYYVKVRVTDKELSDTATVKITLKDVSEKPKIIIDDDDDGEDDSDSICVAHCDTTGRGSDPSDPESKKTLTVAVNENSPTNTEVFSYVVDDEDLGEVGMLSVSLKDERNSGTDSLFKIEMKKVDEKWKVVVSVKDGDKLDYEKIDPRHEVTVIVTDPNGLQDSIRRVIEVRDVNEAPTFVTWPFEFTEHNEPNVVVGHVEHGEDVDTMAISGVKTPDFYIHDQFKLTGGANGADTLFTLLPNGDLVANKRFDFETDPHEYAIYITLSDTLMPDLTETDTVWITLLDKNETPWIETETVDVDENVKKGTVVDTVKADDYDLYDTVLTFTLVEDHS
ncbi:cadherin domain-containing protein, partial [uncultured Fibrobacter sp.]|uniref:cadherin domain-containing protein n=1 Tax=uncultured Fibrobacter sp. TaxID=261512 RepID=UPI0026320861